jgi:hypothetical protein
MGVSKMSAATAKAKEEKPKGNFTAKEALAEIERDSGFALKAIEEFDISLRSPKTAGGPWLATEPAGPMCEFGNTPLEAVKELLQQIVEVV